MSIKEPSKRASDNLPRPQIIGDRVWCPLCNQYTQFIKSADAIELLRLDRRTLYRYIEEGVVHSFKVAGRHYRLCSNCLLKPVER